MHRTTGVHRLARDMTRILKRAVPFDGVGLLTVDPATLLPTSEVADQVASWRSIEMFQYLPLRL